MIFGRQPVAIAAVIAIAINLAITFGLGLTAEQIALINALAVGILALIVQPSVTPTRSPQLAAGTPVTTPEGKAAVVAPIFDTPATPPVVAPN